MSVSGQVYWTVLKSNPDPSSNHLVLGVQTTNSDVWLSIWDGASWVSTAWTLVLVRALFTQISRLLSRVTQVHQDGRLLCTVVDPKYRIWNDGGSGTWGTETDISAYSGPNTANTITLDANPNSNEIMLSIQNGSNDVHCILWNGAAWSAPANNVVTTNSGETKNQPFVFVWNSPGTLPLSLTTAVASDADDAEEYRDQEGSHFVGNVVLDSSDLEFCREDVSGSIRNLYVGLRFLNVNVPSNAKIEYAYISLAKDTGEPTTGQAADAVDLTIKGELPASGSATAFTECDTNPSLSCFDISTRANETAGTTGVPWNIACQRGVA